MDLPDDTRSRLEQIAEQKNRDFEEALSLFEEKVEDVKAQTGQDAEFCYSAALRMVNADLIVEDRVPDSAESVEIIAIGHDGIREWTDRDADGYDEALSWEDQPKKEVTIANGIAIPEDGPMGLAVFVLDENDVDLGAAMEAFQCKNLVRADFSLSDSETRDQWYVGYSTDDMDLQYAEPDSVDEDVESIRDDIHRHVETAELSNITDYLTATQTWNGRKQAAEWGIDVKRVRASIIDVYPGDGPVSPNYTVIDHTVMDESDLEGGPTDAEDSYSAGLTCWLPDGQKAEFADGSLVDLYGTLTRNNETGEVTMNVRGVDPQVTYEYDDSESSDNVETDTF